MRIIGLDADVFTVGSSDCIANLTNISISADREFVDVSGINEMDGVYRLGGRDIEVTATCNIHDYPLFYDTSASGDEVYVVFGWAGDTTSSHSFSMYAYIGSERINFGGRGEAATEEVTLRPSRPGTFTLT